ncbi:UPF0489 family protein [Candidatus Peregrinibacteria bacterium]|nr:UPF0489 family protein [Candidatus Peregrinibacteria bacterium]
MYDHPFQITGNWSNNAFSFDRRKNPTLHVPSLIEGGLGDVVIGDQVVFEDFDETDTLRSCVGLRNFVRMKHPKTGKPIILVDNHNHVFYFWHEAREKGLIQSGATLIHVDQHKDMRRPEGFLTQDESHNLKRVFEYTNWVLNVGNYIVPAMEEGLVGKLDSVTSEKELGALGPVGVQNFEPLRGNLILNIDLDFWAPEMGYIDRKLSLGKTREWMGRADLITIATSPFFIDQALAIKVLGELMA